MTIANTLSVLRVLLVPFILWAVVEQHYGLGLSLCIITGLTDALDGYAARRFQQCTRLGAWLDPFADKLLLISLYITFAIYHLAPVWLVIMLVARDALLWTVINMRRRQDRTRHFKVSILGKAATAAQIMLALLILGALAFQSDFSVGTQLLTSVVVFLTFCSVAMYIKQGYKQVRSQNQ